jgi:iron(III) transport system substrate-binding protein
MLDRRSFIKIAGISAATAGLAACSTTVPKATVPSSSGSALSGQITLYTSEPENKISDIISAFKVHQPNVTVSLYRAATGDLSARIASEVAAGGVRGDVLLAADAPTYEKWKKQNLLEKFIPSDSSKLIKGVVDPEGYYVGTRIIPTIIAYNTGASVVKPKSWNDLIDPQYKSKIAMPNPDVSGAAAFNTALWLATPSLGETWLRALVKNKPAVLASNGPVSQNVAAGTQPIGIVVDYLVRDLAAKGSPIGIIYPSDGVPYISEPAAVFAASQNKPAAKAFVEFLVSVEGQKLAVAQNYLPVRDDVGTPKGATKMSDLKLLQPDISSIATQQAAAVKLFDSLLAGS